MAGFRIPDLPALPPEVLAADDTMLVFDVSADTTKAIPVGPAMSGLMGPIGPDGTVLKSFGGKAVWGTGGGGGSDAVAAHREEITATAGQTAFLPTDPYTPGTLAVYVNGVRLADVEFNDSNGISVVLAEPVAAGDIVLIEYFTGAASPVEATAVHSEVVAAAGQTTFPAPVGFQVGFLSVHVNGLKLADAAFDDSDGVSVVLAAPASAGDIVQMEGFLGVGGVSGDAGTIPVDGGGTVQDVLGVTVIGTDNAAVDTARMLTVAAEAVDGQRVTIIGPLRLFSDVQFAGLTDFVLDFAPGAVVTLDPAGAFVHAGLIFRDCVRAAVYGWPQIYCNHLMVHGIAALSTDATGWSFNKISKEFYVEAKFYQCGKAGLFCRLIEGLTLNRVTLDGKDENENGIFIARSDRVHIYKIGIEGRQAGSPATLTVNGAGLVISPGQSNAGEWDDDPAIAFCEPSHFFGQIKRTAPTGTDTWTVNVEPDFSTYALIQPTTPTSAVKWYFHVAEWATTGEILPEQISITAYGNTPGARTLTLKLSDMNRGIALARNWNGEVVYIYGIRTDRMCVGIQVVGGFINACAGCGIFLLGCDQWTVRGLDTYANRDIGHDAEWSHNGGFEACLDRTTVVNGNCSAAILYGLENQYVTDYTSANEINILGGGEVGSNLRMHNVACTNITFGTIGAGPLLLDEISISQCTFHKCDYGIYIWGAGSNANAKGKHLLKHVRIFDCIVRGAATGFVQWDNIYDLRIEENDIYAAFRLGLQDCRIANSPQSSRITVRNNRMHSFGRLWIGIGVCGFNSTPPTVAPAITFSGNEVVNEIAGTRNNYTYNDGTPVP